MLLFKHHSSRVQPVVATCKPDNTHTQLCRLNNFAGEHSEKDGISWKELNSLTPFPQNCTETSVTQRVDTWERLLMASVEG